MLRLSKSSRAWSLRSPTTWIIPVIKGHLVRQVRTCRGRSLTPMGPLDDSTLEMSRATSWARGSEVWSLRQDSAILSKITVRLRLMTLSRGQLLTPVSSPSTNLIKTKAESVISGRSRQASQPSWALISRILPDKVSITLSHPGTKTMAFKGH